MSNDTRLGAFVIEKNSKINYGFLLALDGILGVGFMNFNMYIQCM
jgi:hypothetical protein